MTASSFSNFLTQAVTVLLLIHVLTVSALMSVLIVLMNVVPGVKNVIVISHLRHSIANLHHLATEIFDNA